MPEKGIKLRSLRSFEISGKYSHRYRNDGTAFIIATSKVPHEETARDEVSFVLGPWLDRVIYHSLQETDSCDFFEFYFLSV